MRRIVPFPLLLMVAICAGSCTTDRTANRPTEVEGFAPVYGDAAIFKTISATSPRATVHPGKIYTVSNILLQVEQDSGIHVINYANPRDPKKIGFIRSYLCKELAMKDGLVYTNNLGDLVVININDINNVREVGRTANVFPELMMQYPQKTDPGSMIYFECPDPSKGAVVAWQPKTLTNPKCRR